MYRRSFVVLAQQGGRRTIVRDPRKKVNSIAVRPGDHHNEGRRDLHPVQPAQRRTPLPFEPNQQDQQTIGSSLGSYALAGVGVTLGFVLVGAILGF